MNKLNRYSKDLLVKVEQDIENYLNTSHTNATKSKHRNFLLIHFVTLTSCMFLGEEGKRLYNTDATYANYANIVVSAMKTQIMKYKAHYKLPDGINFGTLWHIIQSVEKHLMNSIENMPRRIVYNDEEFWF